jgi:hypothetical protein
VHTVGVTLHAEVEATQSVTRKTISSALQNNSSGLIPLHDMLDNWLEHALVRQIVDTIAKWDIDSIVLSIPDTHITELSSTGEVFTVLVERHCHHAICGVECLLHTVTMVHITVDVQNSLVEAKKLNDAEDDIWDQSAKVLISQPT